MPEDIAESATTLVELLRRRAEEIGDKVVFRYLPDGVVEEHRLTYRELDLQARAIAAWLQRESGNDVTGQPVLLVRLSGLDIVPAFFGCLYAGAIPAAVDAGDRLASVAPDAGPVVIAGSAQARQKVAPLLENIDGATALPWCVIEEVTADAERWAQHWTPPRIDANTTAMLEYTSGTTGAPRGARVSHRNILATVDGIRRLWHGDENTVGLAWLALHHNVGLIAEVTYPIFLGATMVVISSDAVFARPMTWLEAVSRHRATITVAFSRAFRACASQSTAEERAAVDLSCLNTIIAGAEAVRPADMRAFIEAFAASGLRPEAVSHSYGLAQGTLTVTGEAVSSPPVIQRLDRKQLQAGRLADAEPGDPTALEVVGCGQPIHGVRLEIVDPETFQIRGERQIGEVWIAGPSVAQGYWHRPKEEERTFRAFTDTGEGPFLRSGDLGFLRDGELFLTGRWSDLITIGTVNHYPSDIEATVQACHPALVPERGAAFLIAPGRRRDTRLAVVQEMRSPHGLDRPELDALVETIRSALAEQHGIDVDAVVLVEENTIPTTTGGKVRRAECRRDLRERKLRAVAEWHRPAANATKRDASRSGAKIPRGGQPAVRIIGRLIEGLAAANKAKAEPWRGYTKELYRGATDQFAAAADITFFNYGYEEDPPLGLPLTADDEPSRFFIQLYAQVASQAGLEDKDVLEVSCGHGGGAAYLTRTHRPRSYTALDLNKAGIDFCVKRHRMPGLTFVHGDAQQLPFADQSFDVVINIEASHGYPDFERFLRQVQRVLRTGGHFLYADFRKRERVEEWERALAKAPLRLVSERNINDEVLRGLRRNSPRLSETIDRNAPPALRRFYRNMCAVEGTADYRALEHGDTSYRMYCFAKD